MWAAAEEMTRIYISIRRLSSFCNEKKKKKNYCTLLYSFFFFSVISFFLGLSS